MSLGSAPQEDGPRTQSIAEQAFTKGLERLKARTITPQGKQTSPRSSVEMVRPRTGSGASEYLEGVQMQGMTGAANPISHVPTETIREKDDVSTQLRMKDDSADDRQRMRKVGYMVIINGRIWVQKVV
jgi:hypothetical protein